MIDYSKLNWFDDTSETIYGEEKHISIYILPYTMLYLFIDVDKHEIIRVSELKGGLSQVKKLSNKIEIEAPHLEALPKADVENFKKGLYMRGVIYD